MTGFRFSRTARFVRSPPCDEGASSLCDAPANWDEPMAHRYRLLLRLVGLFAWATMLAVILTILFRARGSQGDRSRGQ